MGKIKDITGHRFGRLEVLCYSGKNNRGSLMWLCQCECGQRKIIEGCELKRGNVKSCGCLRKEVATKHGHRYTRMYSIWSDVKKRCYNPNSKDYGYYGGRGIKMCDEWNDFVAFYNWALDNGYNENLTLDRKNTNGDYEPSNCRWVTMKKQSNNTRKNRILTFNGETKSISEWSEVIGIPYGALQSRIYRGWSVEKALTTPIN